MEGHTTRNPNTRGITQGLFFLSLLKSLGEGQYSTTTIPQQHDMRMQALRLLSMQHSIGGEGFGIFAYLAGEVKLNGLNANVLRTGRHGDRLWERNRLVGEEEEEDKEKRWEEKLKKRKRMWR